jgi:hypothetical protein
LDNIYKFGRKHEQYNYHCMWASRNCSIETVCASAMVIYNRVLSGKYRFWCWCCGKDVHSYPLVNTTHSMISWLPSPMSLSHIG